MRTNIIPSTQNSSYNIALLNLEPGCSTQKRRQLPTVCQDFTLWLASGRASGLKNPVSSTTPMFERGHYHSRTLKENRLIFFYWNTLEDTLEHTETHSGTHTGKHWNTHWKTHWNTLENTLKHTGTHAGTHWNTH